jgi:hypothetical protein
LSGPIRLRVVGTENRGKSVSIVKDEGSDVKIDGSSVGTYEKVSISFSKRDDGP